MTNDVLNPETIIHDGRQWVSKEDWTTLKQELVDHMWWERTATKLQQQRDEFAARYESASKLLADILFHLPVEPVKLEDGRIMQFVDPNPAQTLGILQAAIKRARDAALQRSSAELTPARERTDRILQAAVAFVEAIDTDMKAAIVSKQAFEPWLELSDAVLCLKQASAPPAAGVPDTEDSPARESSGPATGGVDQAAKNWRAFKPESIPSAYGISYGKQAIERAMGIALSSANSGEKFHWAIWRGSSATEIHVGKVLVDPNELWQWYIDYEDYLPQPRSHEELDKIVPFPK